MGWMTGFLFLVVAEFFSLSPGTSNGPVFEGKYFFLVSLLISK
jgi:hypothetical protein